MKLQSTTWSSCAYDSDIWQPSDDMVTNLFTTFEDNLSHHTQCDFQSSLDAYPFEDADFFNEDFQPLCSDFDRHQVVASPKQSEVSTTKQKYFHVQILGEYLQTKKRRFLRPREEFFYRREFVLHPISPCMGNQQVSLGFLSLSQPSGSSVFLSEDEEELSSTYGSPLQKWIDQACGYTFW
jgi:hypothetical protein